MLETMDCFVYEHTHNLVSQSFGGVDNVLGGEVDLLVGMRAGGVGDSVHWANDEQYFLDTRHIKYVVLDYGSQDVLDESVLLDSLVVFAIESV